VADYPFTTIEPVLGTIEFDERQLVLADIPGLIEGAAEGAGLGHEFLAHVERCGLIVHVVEITRDDGPEAYATVRDELAAYGAGLAELPEVVALSKSDLVPDDRAAEAVSRWRDRLGEGVLGVVAVSAATGAGIDELRGAILAGVEETAPAPTPAAAEPAYEAEHRVYTPAADSGFAVERVGEGAFRVEGRGIELLVARHDLSNAEALGYVEQRLREIGVVSELRRKGFEPGDQVLIGDVAFELDPA
jgi:GTP-binding protein